MKAGTLADPPMDGVSECGQFVSVPWKTLWDPPEF